jgi:hypothetical protein
MCYRPDVPPEQFQINVPSEHLVGRKKGIVNPMFHRNIWLVEIANPMFFQNNFKLMFHRNIWSVEKKEMPIPCSIGTFGGKIFLLYLNNKLSRLTITFAAAHF